MQNTFDQVRQKGAEAMDAVASKSADADQKMRDYQSSVNTAKQNVIDLGQQMGSASRPSRACCSRSTPERSTPWRTGCAGHPQPDVLNLDIIAKGGAGYGAVSGARAAGGPVEAGKTYIVGEHGPEPVTFGADGHVWPNDTLRARPASPSVTNVTYNVGPGQTAAQLAAEHRRWQRRNGRAA